MIKINFKCPKQICHKRSECKCALDNTANKRVLGGDFVESERKTSSDVKTDDDEDDYNTDFPDMISIKNHHLTLSSPPNMTSIFPDRSALPPHLAQSKDNHKFHRSTCSDPIIRTLSRSSTLLDDEDYDANLEGDLNTSSLVFNSKDLIKKEHIRKHSYNHIRSAGDSSSTNSSFGMMRIRLEDVHKDSKKIPNHSSQGSLGTVFPRRSPLDVSHISQGLNNNSSHKSISGAVSSSTTHEASKPIFNRETMRWEGFEEEYMEDFDIDSDVSFENVSPGPAMPFINALKNQFPSDMELGDDESSDEWDQDFESGSLVMTESLRDSQPNIFSSKRRSSWMIYRNEAVMNKEIRITPKILFKTEVEFDIPEHAKFNQVEPRWEQSDGTAFPIENEDEFNLDSDSESEANGLTSQKKNKPNLSPKEPSVTPRNKNSKKAEDFFKLDHSTLKHFIDCENAHNEAMKTLLSASSYSRMKKEFDGQMFPRSSPIDQQRRINMRTQSVSNKNSPFSFVNHNRSNLRLNQVHSRKDSSSESPKNSPKRWRKSSNASVIQYNSDFCHDSENDLSETSANSPVSSARVDSGASDAKKSTAKGKSFDKLNAYLRAIEQQSSKESSPTYNSGRKSSFKYNNANAMLPQKSAFERRVASLDCKLGPSISPCSVEHHTNQHAKYLHRTASENFNRSSFSSENFSFKRNSSGLFSSQCDVEREKLDMELNITRLRSNQEFAQQRVAQIHNLVEVTQRLNNESVAMELDP